MINYSLHKQIWAKLLKKSRNFGDLRNENSNKKVGNNNGQLHIANTTSGGARKVAWANFYRVNGLNKLMISKNRRQKEII